MLDSSIPVQISAGHMYLAKWLLPILTFVGVSVWTIASKMPHTAMDFVSHGFALCVLGFFLVYFLRRDIWGLADQVLDGGDFLLVHRGNKQDRISLANVAGVDVTHQLNSTRIVLRLRTPGVFGDKIAFLPKVTHRWGGRNDIADDLAERVARFHVRPDI
jgi:hypothetical protein